MKLYKEELEKITGGKIKVDLYFQSQLGTIPRQIEGVQLGTIEAFTAPMDFFVGADPRFGVFSAPMLFKSEESASKAIADPELNKIILGLGNAKGMVGIGTFLIGASNYTAKDPILKVSDFNGKKLRINGTALEREKMRRLGATAVPLSLGEVLPSLQRGTIDGTMSATAIFVSFKFNDVVNVMTETNDTMIISTAVVSKAWFDKLPPDLQNAVVAAGQAVQPRVAQWQREFAAINEKKWIEVGGKIQRFSPEEKKQLESLLTTVGDDVTKDQPAVQNLLKSVRAIASKYR
jgi:TRAP-type C4-dicarboxylate transport system substrate-binding protein